MGPWDGIAFPSLCDFTDWDWPQDHLLQILWTDWLTDCPMLTQTFLHFLNLLLFNWFNWTLLCSLCSVRHRNVQVWWEGWTFVKITLKKLRHQSFPLLMEGVKWLTRFEFCVSGENNRATKLFSGPFSMTYLLELTIMKIYWDHNSQSTQQTLQLGVWQGQSARSRHRGAWDLNESSSLGNYVV